MQRILQYLILNLEVYICLTTLVKKVMDDASAYVLWQLGSTLMEANH